MMHKHCQKVSLSEILIERNETPDPDLLRDVQIPIISKIRFSDGEIEFRTNTTTKTKMILIYPGDLVLSGINAMKGAIAIYDPKSTQKAAATIHYSAYQVNKDILDVRYIWWLLRSQYFQYKLSKQVPQGIKTELKATRLLPVKVSIPELAQQQKIVGRLQKITQLINEAEYLHLSTANIYGNLITNCLTEELINYKERRPFRDFFSEAPRNGLSLQAITIKKNSEQTLGLIPFIKLSAISFGNFNPNAVKLVDIDLPDSSPFWIEPNDLLMGRGNSIELVGRVVLYRGEKKKFAFPDLTIRLRVDPQKALPEFVELFMNSYEAREYIETSATGTSSTMKKVSQPIIAAMPFPVIPIGKQKLIIDRIRIIQKRVDEIHQLQKRSLSALHCLTKSVVKNAFSKFE